MLWMKYQLQAKTLQQAKQNSRRVYREHYAEIRRVAPKERLLEYDLGSGWEPLCSFLGKEIPTVAFPHANETKTLKKVFEEMVKKAILSSFKNMGMVLSTIIAAGFAVYLAMA